MNIEILAVTFVLGFLANANAWDQSGITQESDAAVKKIADARFDLEGITTGEHKIVGRLSIRRQFLGTGVTPSFADVVRFHSFDGTELKFVSVADAELKKSLLKQLANGQGIPVIISVDFKVKRVGHDGINMSTRITGKINSCEELSPTLVAIASGTAGRENEELKRFQASLKPEGISNDVAVSLGSIFVRSKTSRRGSAVSISNINVFNPRTDPATIKIKGMQIEQKGVAQKCTLSDRSGPEVWEIVGESWADGVYEEGKMPKRLWSFEPTDPIEPKEEVTIRLEMEINGEVVTLKRTATPM